MSTQFKFENHSGQEIKQNKVKVTDLFDLYFLFLFYFFLSDLKTFSFIVSVHTNILPNLCKLSILAVCAKKMLLTVRRFYVIASDSWVHIKCSNLMSLVSVKQE